MAFWQQKLLDALPQYLLRSQKRELARSGADFVAGNFEQLQALIETREGGRRSR
jgi:hypothetical protein